MYFPIISEFYYIHRLEQAIQTYHHKCANGYDDLRFYLSQKINHSGRDNPSHLNYLPLPINVQTYKDAITDNDNIVKNYEAYSISKTKSDRLIYRMLSLKIPYLIFILSFNANLIYKITRHKISWLSACKLALWSNMALFSMSYVPRLLSKCTQNKRALYEVQLSHKRISEISKAKDKIFYYLSSKNNNSSS
jgi:hypothetical protein